MSLPAALLAKLADERLFVGGMLHEGEETLVMLSPDEPGFWAHVTAQPEFADGLADPLDRWSKRVIGALAGVYGGRAIFPSDGPPYAPFYDWARRSRQAFPSPIRLLVHTRMGLWTSYRGVLALPGHLPLPAPAKSPCGTCSAPCTTACPAGALSTEGYDVPACHTFLDSAEGENCLSFGCLARRSCPLAESYGRLATQSAWHMRHFHK